MKRPTTPLTTRAFAAHLTWKQYDIMLLLVDGPLNVDELSALLTEIHDDEIAANERLYYLSTSIPSTYSTLYTLEKRGLVSRNHSEDRDWTLTPSGRQIIRQYEDNPRR